MKGKALEIAAVVAAIAALGGCSGSSETSGSGEKAPGSGSRAAKLQITGSDTMLQLAQAWAGEFMKAHPDIQVTVSGGGSNTGLKALVNGTTDIANASREIKPSEREAIEKAGRKVVEFIVARDALSVIVNPQNPVSELTMDQLKQIYSGQVTNWKQVGGPDMNIVLNSRESSSGTYTFFQEHVLGKGVPFAATAMLQPSTQQIVDNVAQDKGGIGYVGLGYMSPKVKMVKVKKDASSPAVPATAEDVVKGDYPLARPLYQYMSSDPEGAAKTWIDWVLGPEGQAVVKKMEFVPAKN